MEREISAHLLKLRRSNPFLATISLYAQYEFSKRVERFEADGIRIYINPDYLNRLQEKQKTGTLLHVTLHAALLHGQRVGFRNQVVWNIAADIVVNNIITESGDFQIPPGTAAEKKYANLSVEQVYEALMHLHNKSEAIGNAVLAEPAITSPDYSSDRDEDGHGSSGINAGERCQTSNGRRPSVSQIQAVLERVYPCYRDLSASSNPKTTSNLSDTDSLKCRQYWQGAFRKADTVARMSGRQQGDVPAGLLREIDKILNAELDWRWILWNFVVRTPSDFGGFDRRFVHQGLYLDSLESERLNVVVAIDTSGSIDQDELSKFIGELEAISCAYHFINVILYYVDADIYGPHELVDGVRSAAPKGGGGTDFSVFFDRVDGLCDARELDVIVYFSDGHGKFPEQKPTIDTLWVVTAGGLESEYFPFGQVTRLAG